LFRQKVRLVNIWLENIFFHFWRAPKKERERDGSFWQRKGARWVGERTEYTEPRADPRPWARRESLLTLSGSFFLPLWLFFLFVIFLAPWNLTDILRLSWFEKGWFHVHGLLKIDW
jgi:hypothetical protein